MQITTLDEWADLKNFTQTMGTI